MLHITAKRNLRYNIQNELTVKNMICHYLLAYYYYQFVRVRNIFH